MIRDIKYVIRVLRAADFLYHYEGSIYGPRDATISYAAIKERGPSQWDPRKWAYAFDRFDNAKGKAWFGRLHELANAKEVAPRSISTPPYRHPFKEWRRQNDSIRLIECLEPININVVFSISENQRGDVFFACSYSRGFALSDYTLDFGIKEFCEIFREEIRDLKIDEIIDERCAY